MRKVCQWWWWQTKFNVSPGPGLLSRSMSRSGPDWDLTWTGPGPDLGPGLGPGLGPEPELDNLSFCKSCFYCVFPKRVRFNKLKACQEWSPLSQSASAYHSLNELVMTTFSSDILMSIVKLRVRVRVNVKLQTSNVKTRPWGRGCNWLAHHHHHRTTFFELKTAN